MASVQAMIETQLLMLIILAAGFIAAKVKVVSQDSHQTLSALLINVILPCNIVMSFQIQGGTDYLAELLIILVIAFAAQFFYLLLSRVMFNKTPPEQAKVLKYAIICPNSSFMGLPISEAVFGQLGAMYASISLLPLRIFMWSSGLSLFTKTTSWKSTLKKLALHPCIISVFFGLILMVTPLELPGVLATSLTTIGRCTTTVSMLTIGIILSGVEYKGFIDKNLLVYTGVRLLLIPFVITLVLFFAPISKTAAGVTVLLSGMPAGSTTAILASQYNADMQYASKMVFISTIFSFVTLPFWIWLIQLI